MKKFSSFLFPLMCTLVHSRRGKKEGGEARGSTERPLTVGKSIISMAKPAANSSDTARAHPCPHPGLSPRKDRAGSGGTAVPWHPGLLAGARRGRSPRSSSSLLPSVLAAPGAAGPGRAVGAAEMDGDDAGQDAATGTG